jgi:hypothetical protein
MCLGMCELVGIHDGDSIAFYVTRSYWAAGFWIDLIIRTLAYGDSHVSKQGSANCRWKGASQYHYLSSKDKMEGQHQDSVMMVC